VFLGSVWEGGNPFYPQKSTTTAAAAAADVSEPFFVAGAKFFPPTIKFLKYHVITFSLSLRPLKAASSSSSSSS